MPDEEEVQGRQERSRRELPHLGSGSGGRGGGSPKKICSKLLVVANIVRQVLQIERHFDLGLGTWDVDSDGIHPRRGRGKSQREGYPAKAVLEPILKVG